MEHDHTIEQESGAVIKIFHRRHKVALNMLGNFFVLFVLFAYLPGWTAIFSAYWWTIIFLLLIPARFVALVFKDWRRLNRGEAALVLTPTGIEVLLLGYRTGPVLWSEIKSVKVVRQWFGLTQQIGLVLHDPKKIIQREPRWWCRLGMWRDQWLLQTPFLWDVKLTEQTQQEQQQLLKNLLEGNHDFNDFSVHLIDD